MWGGRALPWTREAALTSRSSAAAASGAERLAAAPVGAGAARDRGPPVAPPVGRDLWALGLSMAQHPAIDFRDLTLGYDRHPAVHHITGEVAQANCSPSSGRTAPANRRCSRASSASSSRSAAHRPRRPQQPRHRLSAAADRHRPQLPDLGVRLRGHGAVARDRRLARPRCAAQARGRRRARHGRPARSRRPPGRRAVGRPVPARAVRAPAAARRRADPARRAVPRRRHQDRRRSHRADPALARRGPHRARRAARHRAGARAFPRDAAARPRGGGLGRDAQSADASQSRQVAPAVEAFDEHAEICERTTRSREREPA